MADKLFLFQQLAERALASIEEVLAPEMKLTLIARHPDDPEKCLLMTLDDLDKVRETIADLQQKENRP